MPHASGMASRNRELNQSEQLARSSELVAILAKRSGTLGVHTKTPSHSEHGNSEHKSNDLCEPLCNFFTRLFQGTMLFTMPDFYHSFFSPLKNTRAKRKRQLLKKKG